jgi:hypothetical protein
MFNLQQLPRSVQILHSVPVELRSGSAPFGLQSYVPLLAALDSRLQSYIVKEQKDALDNLCNSVGFVGVGSSNVLHRFRANSRPVSHCVGSNGISPASGTQGCLVYEIYLSVMQHRYGLGSGLLLRLQESKNMPLVNVVIALIVVGVLLWLNQYVYPHGLRHQDHSECSDCGC